MPFVYIVRCADGTLYVGHTADLAVREKAHNEGTAAAYTAKRRPVRVVYSEEHPTTQAAITRDASVEALVNQEEGSPHRRRHGRRCASLLSAIGIRERADLHGGQRRRSGRIVVSFFAVPGRVVRYFSDDITI